MRYYYRSLDGALGDTRSDIVSTLSIVLGHDKAENLMKGFEDLIKTKAREGAEAAIPTIKAQVIQAVTGKEPEIRAQVEASAKAAVKPLLIGAMAAGGAGALFGIVALVKLKRARR